MSMWAGSNQLINLVTGFLPRKICFSSRPSNARFMMDTAAMGLWSTPCFRASINPSVLHHHSLLNSNNAYLLVNIYIYIYIYIHTHTHTHKHTHTQIQFTILYQTLSDAFRLCLICYQWSENQGIINDICMYTLSLKGPAHIDLHVQDIVLLDTDFQCSSDP